MLPELRQNVRNNLDRAAKLIAMPYVHFRTPSSASCAQKTDTRQRCSRRGEWYVTRAAIELFPRAKSSGVQYAEVLEQ